MRILIFFKLPYLDNTFQNIAKKIQLDSYTFLLSSLTCRQIWQSLLVDHHQPTHLKNVGKCFFLKKNHCSSFLEGKGQIFQTSTNCIKSKRDFHFPLCSLSLSLYLVMIPAQKLVAQVFLQLTTKNIFKFAQNLG